MGAVGSSVEILEIEVPAETVWATIADLEASPFIIQTVSSLLRTGSKGDFEVGTTWHETRIHKGREFVLHKTITAIVDPNNDNDENNKERSVSIAVNYTASNPLVQDAANTSTLTVIPISASSCQLMATIAFSTPGLLSKIELTLCGCCVRRMIGKSILAELSDYEIEATKREQERLTLMTRKKMNEENEKKDAAADS
jgi:hypothetical protein